MGQEGDLVSCEEGGAWRGQGGHREMTKDIAAVFRRDGEREWGEVDAFLGLP